MIWLTIDALHALFYSSGIQHPRKPVMLKRSALTLLFACCLWCGPATALAPGPPVEVSITLPYAFDAPANSHRDGLLRLALDDSGAPRIEVTPGEIIAALPLGGTTTLPLTIANTGTEELVVDLWADGQSVSPLSLASTADYTMLLVTPRPDTGLDALQQVLNGLNDVAYAVWEPARGAPAVDDLLIYDVVLVGNRHLWEASGVNPEALGNALADYIDLGGKVIDTQLVHADSDSGLVGRYIAEGYAPVTSATGYVVGDFQVEIVDAAHPLMDQVASMSTHARLNVTARSEAAVPAVYAGTSIPYVAANESVVFVNQQLFGDDWGAGDLGPLLHNAVLWLCGERGPWVAVEPAYVSIAPGGSFEATVTLDSTDAHAPSVFAGKIHLDSNDPVDANLIVPVELAVLADLTTGRLAGVIRSNRTGAPLAGAHIEVQATGSDARLRTTDARGAYSFWLTPATYAVTVSAADYLAAEVNVTVTPQGRITHDVALVRDAPWLRLDETDFDCAVPLGWGCGHALVLHNDGTQPLEIAVALVEAADWMSVDRDSLTIAPGGQYKLYVTLDTAAFGQPQYARALLRLLSNDPDAPEVIVPVDVEATLPAGYGLVSGTVTCLRSGQPLPAKVIVMRESLVLAHVPRADGSFGPWAVPAGVWTVLMDPDGYDYVLHQQEITVTAEETTTASAALLLDAPWLRLTPEYLVARDAPSGAATLAVILANEGAQPLHYALALEALPAWATIAPSEGVVAVGVEETLMVQIDTAAAPPGWTVVSVPITSNDPWQSPAALRLYVRRGQALMAPVMLRR
jgi:hypothetical protein